MHNRRVVTVFVALVALLSTLCASLAILVDPATGDYPSLGPPPLDDGTPPTPAAVWGLHQASIAFLLAASFLSLALPYLSANSSVLAAATLCMLDPLWLGFHLSFLHHRSQTTCWQRHPLNITFVNDETAIMLPDGQILALSDHRLEGGPFVGRGPMLWALLHLERRFDPLERACVALEMALAAFAVCAIVHLCTFALIYEARTQTSEVDSVLQRLPIVKYADAAARTRALGYPVWSASNVCGGQSTTDRTDTLGVGGIPVDAALMAQGRIPELHQGNLRDLGVGGSRDPGRQEDYSARSDASDGDTCAICLSGYEPNEEVRILPCRHYLHRRCLDKWVEHKKRDATCPLCKQRLQPRVGGRRNSSRAEFELV